MIVDRDGPVKVSFFGLPRMPRIAPPSIAIDIGLKIAACIDLAGTKASVVQVRAEAKDCIVLDALIAYGVDLSIALAAGAAIYGPGFNPQVTLKALSYFGDGDLATLAAALKARLIAAIRGVDPDQLSYVLRESGADGDRQDIS